MAARWTASLKAAICVAVASVALLGGAARAAAYQNVAIPAYFYPGSYWTQLTAAAPTVGLAIANPDSGPGWSEDSSDTTTIAAAQIKGVSVIGYVNTASGNTLVPLATAETQVDEYMNWYSVDGIFFDDDRTTSANEVYYTALKNYVKTYGSGELVVLNPGSEVADANYGKIADVLVTYEGTYSDYISTSSTDYNRYVAASWYSKYSLQKFWHIIIDCTSKAKMKNALSLSQSRRAGYVFITTDTTLNPYDTLPQGSYWTEELSGVKAL